MYLWIRSLCPHWTTLLVGSQTFVLVTAGRGGLDVYDAVLDSFAVLQRAGPGTPVQGSPQPSPLPGALPPGDPCTGGGSGLKARPLCPPP